MNGSPSCPYTSQTSLATFPLWECHGNMRKLSRSGYRYMSDSSIRTKPSTEDPSNIHLLSNAFSSCLAVIATFFSVPNTSENCSRINCTSFSLTRSMTSCLVYRSISSLLFSFLFGFKIQPAVNIILSSYIFIVNQSRGNTALLK